MQPGVFGLSIEQWPMSGGCRLRGAGIDHLRDELALDPDGTGMPAGTSAVISVDDTHVVGSRARMAPFALSDSSSSAPATKSSPKSCTPKLVALWSTLGPMACRTAGVPAGGGHRQFGCTPGTERIVRTVALLRGRLAHTVAAARRLRARAIGLADSRTGGGIEPVALFDGRLQHVVAAASDSPGGGDLRARPDADFPPEQWPSKYVCLPPDDLSFTLAKGA